MELRAASSVADFAADPLGAYVSGDSWLYFHPVEGLTGYFLWELPSPDDLEVLLGVIRAAARLPRHASILEASSVRHVPRPGFARLEEFVRDNGEILGRSVSKLALVRPPGVVGAVVAGFFTQVPAPYPSQVFESLRTALDWLGISPTEDVCAALEQLRNRRTPIYLRDLRTLLDADPSNASAPVCARRIGLSLRTLHRRLAALSTTFHKELTAARVRAAKRLLLESEAPLTRIAADVGFGSLSAFSAAFKERTGEAPSAYRAREGARLTDP